jgi:hypothetical protein
MKRIPRLAAASRVLLRWFYVVGLTSGLVLAVPRETQAGVPLRQIISTAKTAWQRAGTLVKRLPAAAHEARLSKTVAAGHTAESIATHLRTSVELVSDTARSAPRSGYAALVPASSRLRPQWIIDTAPVLERFREAKQPQQQVQALAETFAENQSAARSELGQVYSALHSACFEAEAPLFESTHPKRTLTALRRPEPIHVFASAEGERTFTLPDKPLILPPHSSIEITVLKEEAGRQFVMYRAPDANAPLSDFVGWVEVSERVSVLRQKVGPIWRLATRGKGPSQAKVQGC